jgi:integrase
LSSFFVGIVNVFAWISKNEKHHKASTTTALRIASTIGIQPCYRPTARTNPLHALQFKNRTSLLSLGKKLFTLPQAKAHPSTMGKVEIEQFLSWLANERKVAPSTHKQALSALIFFYRKVINNEIPWLNEIGRPQAPQRLPVVLTKDEVQAIFSHLPLIAHVTFAKLLYGTGMRISEALQLRIKDLQFSQNAIIVRSGKGNKDRVVMLPQSLIVPLQVQTDQARHLYNLDRASGANGVYLPFALEKKYPNAGKTWGWFTPFVCNALAPVRVRYS